MSAIHLHCRKRQIDTCKYLIWLAGRLIAGKRMPKSFDRVGGNFFKNVAMENYFFRKFTFMIVLLIISYSFSYVMGREKKPKFFYSNYGAKTLSTSQVVSVPDGSGEYLVPRLKYLFSYDESNRIIKKEALKWNVVDNDWVYSFCLTFAYDDDTMITEYARWNKQRESYDECTEKVVYKKNANMYASYSLYKRSLPDGEWMLEHNYLVNIPAETFWDKDGIFIAEADK